MSAFWCTVLRDICEIAHVDQYVACGIVMFGQYSYRRSRRPVNDLDWTKTEYTYAFLDVPAVARRRADTACWDGS